jgi:hypothetical protein
MSRFIEAIRHRMTGRKFPLLEPLSVVMNRRKDGEQLEAHDFRTADEFEYEVAWRVRVKCEQPEANLIGNSVLRELREAVYGDLRDRIIRLERAVYEQDRERILMETRDIVNLVMHE